MDLRSCAWMWISRSFGHSISGTFCGCYASFQMLIMQRMTPQLHGSSASRNEEHPDVGTCCRLMSVELPPGWGCMVRAAS